MPPRAYPQSPFGGIFGRPPPATKWLMIATGVLSVATMFSAGAFGGGLLAQQLLFSPAQVLDAWRIWTAFTWLFVTLDPLSLLLHLAFGLWMFGAQLEHQWGSRRFLFFFFATGTGAAIVTCLLAIAFPSLRDYPAVAFSGTTVALEAMVLGWVLMNWHSQVLLYFFPVRAPYLLVFGVAFPLLDIIRGRWQPAIPVLLAMAIGYLLLNRRLTGRRAYLHFRAWWIDRQLKRRARRLRVVPPPDDQRDDRKTYLH